MKLLLICLFSFFSLSSQADFSQLADTIDQIKPSIVAVGTYLPSRAPRAQFKGTGFVIGDGRFVVTNEHVLSSPVNAAKNERIAVFIKKNNKDSLYYANKIASDIVHDIAILKLEKTRLPALKLSRSKVREGELYAFTGYPIGMVLGLYPVTHQGIISAISPVVIPMIKSRHLNAKIIKRLRNPYMVYQLDATAYPGNSGSPLFNTLTGEVIGIINKVFVKESKEKILSEPSGITYAIPASHLVDLLKKHKISVD